MLFLKQMNYTQLHIQIAILQNSFKNSYKI